MMHSLPFDFIFLAMCLFKAMSDSSTLNGRKSFIFQSFDAILNLNRTMLTEHIDQYLHLLTQGDFIWIKKVETEKKSRY